MNIPLLRKIQQRIRKEPEHFVMDSYETDLDVLRSYHPEFKIPKSYCGTAYCIAGLAVRLDNSEESWCCSTFGQARELLGLSDRQAVTLFHREQWPKQFVAKDFSKSLPKKAIARIDHFIKTKGKE